MMGSICLQTQAFSVQKSLISPIFYAKNLTMKRGERLLGHERLFEWIRYFKIFHLLVDKAKAISRAWRCLSKPSTVTAETHGTSLCRHFINARSSLTQILKITEKTCIIWMRDTLMFTMLVHYFNSYWPVHSLKKNLQTSAYISRANDDKNRLQFKYIAHD